MGTRKLELDIIGFHSVLLYIVFMRTPSFFIFIRKDILLMKVRAKDYENVQSLLRRFRKACENEGIIRELKKRDHYEKPCDQRRRKLYRGIRKQQQLLEEQGLHNDRRH